MILIVELMLYVGIVLEVHVWVLQQDVIVLINALIVEVVTACTGHMTI
jgi:hypothetical protein